MTFLIIASMAAIYTVLHTMSETLEGGDVALMFAFGLVFSLVVLPVVCAVLIGLSNTADRLVDRLCSYSKVTRVLAWLLHLALLPLSFLAILAATIMATLSAILESLPRLLAPKGAIIGPDGGDDVITESAGMPGRSGSVSAGGEGEEGGKGGKGKACSISTPINTAKARRRISTRCSGFTVFAVTVNQEPTAVRMAFLRKVYGILTVQILATTAVCVAFLKYPEIQEFAMSNVGLLYAAFFGPILILLALFYFRNQFPINYFLLALFTCLEAYGLGVTVSFYNVQSVIVATFITAGLFVALTAYTMQSKYDFSSFAAPALMALWLLIIVSLIQIFFRFKMPGMELAISAFGAALFSVLVVVDTHLIMQKLPAEEYILGALTLYLDFLNLFLYVLRLVGNPPQQGSSQ